MNKELVQLYEGFWDSMVSSLIGNGLANPLLLHIEDEEKYKAAEIKIMFFGQETNGWEGELGSKRIDELVETYSSFLKKSYSGQFWNAVRDYVRTTKETNPDKNIEFIWNNTLKFGKAEGKGAPDQNLINIQKEVFPVISEEIKILKPNQIIFFTGPNYDNYLKNEWDEMLLGKVKNYDERQLALIKHKNLPINTFRTYHPNFLYRQGKQFFSDIKETIITY